jgi:WD40 repeat protein
VELGKKILSMKHSGRLYSVKFNPTGKILASGSSDGTIRIWDFVSGKEILRIEGSETENIKFKTEKKNVK